MAKEKTKWRWEEFAQWKEKQQGKQDGPGEDPIRPGQCEECRGGSFALKVKNGRMDRICRGCGVIVENV